MGMYHHDAVIVTESLDIGTRLRDARDKAVELGLLVSDVVKGTTNGYGTFLVAPDGSKEGWDESNAFDAKREAFISWLKAKHYYTWAHVGYGELGLRADSNGESCHAPVER